MFAIADVVNRQAAQSARRESTHCDWMLRRMTRFTFLTFSKRFGKQTVELAQRALYDRLLRTKYEGRSNIPYHTNS